jgi:hypothetical protein
MNNYGRCGRSLFLVVRATLLQYLYETYTRARIEQLFNIIIEFPDSQPALEDLRYASCVKFEAL